MSLNKILIVVPSFDNGGTISSLKNILRKIDCSQCSVDVFPITNSGPNFKDLSLYANVLGVNLDNTNVQNDLKARLKARLFRMIKKIKKSLCLIGIDISTVVFKRVARTLEKNNYDQVIAFQEGQATLLVSLIRNVSKVAWIRCDYSKLPLTKKKINRNQKIYQRFDKVICVSVFTKGQFLSIHPTFSNKTIALHNIIAVDRIKNLSTDVPDAFELEPNTVLNLVSIGRLAPVKRFSAIPGIAADLNKQGLVFKWYIIGADDSDKVNIEKEVAAKHVEDSVILLGNKNNPYPYIANADALICTSVSEACPNVINEAKILGTPIVSTDFGSVYEMLNDGVEGVITPIENMSKVILSLLTDHILLTTIKSNLSHYLYDNNKIVSLLNTETKFVISE